MSIIVREEHNVGNITIADDAIETGLLVAAGIWDAVEMGISRSDALAQVNAANTPEARARVIADLKERAIQRASLDTSTGRVAVFTAGQMPWHGLGVSVAEAATSAEAIKLAGLDWTVRKTALSYSFPNNGIVPDQRFVTDTFAIVRNDTHNHLGTVGARYAPIQNADAFAFLDGVLKDFGAAYESAGSIYGGKKVWMLAHMPKQTFSVNGGDEIEPYVLFSNCHDGSGAAWCFPTTVRVVCANTFRMAQRSRKGLYMRHDGSVHSKLEVAREQLGLAVKSFGHFHAAADALYQRKANIDVYANRVLDQIMSVTQADLKVGAMAVAERLGLAAFATQIEARKIERIMEHRGKRIKDIKIRFDSDRCNIGSMGGTLWAAFNAFTEHADFYKMPRESSVEEIRLSRRFESIMVGDADHAKQVALELAMAS